MDVENLKPLQESESSSSNSSRVESEQEEWSYSLFSDTLITLHLVTATFYLAYTLKNLLVELYIPLTSLGSPAILVSELVKVVPAVCSIFLRPEILVSVVVILMCIYIGKEIGNFRVLRILGNHLAYLLTKFMFYIVIVLHYYCVRIFVEYKK